MRLRITHATRYEYSRPIVLQRHRLVLRPREGHDLHVEQMRLRITPEHHLHWVRDAFGNSIALVDFCGTAVGELDIVSDVIVERSEPFPDCERHEPWRASFPPSYDPMEAAITSVYLAPAYVEDIASVQSWLAESFVPDPTDAEGSVLTLCRLIASRINYLRRYEKGVQTPGHTLTRGSGSCRDMATLMMDTARTLGVAARFVSGYLHGAASRAGQASTHAWVEVYLPLIGWRGFDPVTGKVVSSNHIAVGVSSHPRGVMPVSGTFSGSANDCRALRVSVKTEEILGDTSSPV